MDTSMFKVTKDWIHKHKTPRGAWTKAQIEALGLEWPARQGWISQISGELISNQQARMFEEGKTVKAKSKKSVNAAYKALMTDFDSLNADQVCTLHSMCERWFSK